MDLGTHQRVLIVEDDPHLGRQLREMLEFLGFCAQVAPTGPEGVSRFREAPSDMVICDLMLPGMNGVQTIEEIRRLPLGSRVPVFLMSAVYRNPKHFEKELRRLHVLEFIPKPFSVIDVGRRVAAILAGAEELEAESPEITETGSWRMSELALALGDSPNTFPPVGTFQRKILLNVFIGIFRGHAAGELVVARGRATRHIFFLNGYPVFAESDDRDESICAVLARAGQLPAAQAAEVEERARTSGRSVAAQLLDDGLITERRLVVAERDRVRQIVLGTFAWPQGQYEFKVGDAFGDHIGIFEVNPVRCLGEAVLRHLPTNEVAIEVQALAEGRVRPGPRFRRLFPYLDLPRGLEGLGPRIEQGPILNDLFREQPTVTEPLIKLLWLMLQLDIVEGTTAGSPRPAPPSPAIPRVVAEAQPSPITASLPSVRPPDEPPLDDRARAVLHDYLSFMGEEPRALLGLNAGASPEQITTAVRQRRERWALQGLSPSTPSEVRTKAKELLSRLNLVESELIGPSAADAVPTLEGARALVAAGRYGDALPTLRELLPSYPEVSQVWALLGLARWRAAPLDPDSRLEARGLLERAVAMEPTAIQPWRWMGDLAESSGDAVGLRRAAGIVRDLNPDDPWLIRRGLK